MNWSLMISFALIQICPQVFAQSQNVVTEKVYVETTTDTDSDGKLDRIYVSISRPISRSNLSTIFHMSPYALGGNDVENHSVDSEVLPQEEELFNYIASDLDQLFAPVKKSLLLYTKLPALNTTTYAKVLAHSIGTGYSTGCPTVGDMAEALGAKAVIDWLNGRAPAYYQDGKVAKADWANGKVGMSGVSYDGTLPIMVAATGVEGLKAIVPIAAISRWYDYYRANGLVVNPGGYIGEDVDTLGYFIVRKGTCKKELEAITATMGRENGDFTPFWQVRDSLSLAQKIKAATFIIHGQNDWNVKQKHAIQLWEALEGVTPRRMFLHRGGHGSTNAHKVPQKVQAWFDHFLEGVDNGITDGPQVEVELPNGALMVQQNWPHEETKSQRYYLTSSLSLSSTAGEVSQQTITDVGRIQKIQSLMVNPEQKNQGRLLFLGAPLTASQLISGTSEVSLNLAVLNRKAANITVALIEYKKDNKGTIITRGWADPQNYFDQAKGELLVPGRNYQLTFKLEPKQYVVAEGSRIGVMVTATDWDFTLRPKEGTQIQFNLGEMSFIDLFVQN